MAVLWIQLLDAHTQQIFSTQRGEGVAGHILCTPCHQDGIVELLHHLLFHKM